MIVLITAPIEYTVPGLPAHAGTVYPGHADAATLRGYLGADQYDEAVDAGLIVEIP